MSTRPTGLRGVPPLVRILLLLLLLILLLLLVVYAVLPRVPRETLRRLLGVTITPAATPLVAVTDTPAVTIMPSPTSTPIVIVGTAPAEETATPTSTSPATVAVPAAATPTATATAAVVVPSPTRPATATPTATATPLRTVVAPLPSPIGAEVGVVAEEVSPTATATLLPTPSAPVRIATRVTTGEVMRNGDFSGEFLRGGVASEWQLFHNDAATFWCYPDTLRTTSGEMLRSQTLHIHGAALPDRYLGIYQTVDVVPGGIYTFTIAGLVRTPQGDVQQTGYGYRMQVGFDPQGRSNWQAVESWIELPWDEQPRDQPSYRVEVFTTTVTARQPQLTVFIRAWKKWADAGEGMYDITRVSLVGPVVTALPQPSMALVSPTPMPEGTLLAAATPTPLPPALVVTPTVPPGITPPIVAVPTPLPPSAIVAPLTPTIRLTPTPEATELAIAELPAFVVTPAVPVTGDTLLTLGDAHRTVITALLVVLLLLGGALYRWRPWSAR